MNVFVPFDIFRLNQDQQRKRNADSEPASGARAKSQEQSKLSSGSWQLFEDNDAYEIGSKPTPVGARMAKSEDTASVSLMWRNLKVSGSKNTLESMKATLVTDGALMAVVPTARVATFVRRNSVSPTLDLLLVPLRRKQIFHLQLDLLQMQKKIRAGGW